MHKALYTEVLEHSRLCECSGSCYKNLKVMGKKC